MPARTGPSSCSTVMPILRRPSARRVPRCFWVSPIWLRTCVIRTFAIALLLRLLGRLVGEHLGDGQAAHLRHLIRAAKPLEAIDRRLRHVDRVRRAKALGEDVADSRELEHGAHAAARDHAGALARRSEEDAGCVRATEDLVRDRRAVLGDGEEVLLRVLDRLRDRQRHLARLAVADADPVDLVPDHDERGEGEAPATLDHLGDAVDLDHAFLELAAFLPLDDGALDAGEFRPGAQNLSPPSRAASASALTRPW